jgi:hypothetical protein
LYVCTYAVRDADENTMPASAQTYAHAKRKRDQDVTSDDLRPLMGDVHVSEREREHWSARQATQSQPEPASHQRQRSEMARGTSLAMLCWQRTCRQTTRYQEMPLVTGSSRLHQVP